MKKVEGEVKRGFIHSFHHHQHHRPSTMTVVGVVSVSLNTPRPGLIPEYPDAGLEYIHVLINWAPGLFTDRVT